MNFAAITDVKLVERQRSEIKPGELLQLKQSIAAHGLIHAPALVIEKDQTHRLVAGGRRFEAMRQLHQEGIEFTYQGAIVPEGQIPYSTLGELSNVELAEVELEENILRADLSWQDETLAKKRIHELRLAANPDHKVIDTAREIVAAKGDQPPSLISERLAVAESLIVAEHLSDPMVMRARSRKEAARIILDKFEDKIKGAAILEDLKCRQSDNHQIIRGDCLVELKKLPSGIVDTIICDPPYGMNADKMGKGEFHMYDDSPDSAAEICRAIITEGFRIAKPKAILFMFTDIDQFVSLRTFAAQQAWSVWRYPLIWRKGTDGHSPWGRAGFIRTTEMLLFAVKGQKELVYPGGPDVLDFKRPGRSERVHSAEKPVALLEHLIRISTLPGMTVLDPTAGSGPIISAARTKHCKVIAIEKDQTHYEQCLQRLSGREPSPDLDDDGGDYASDLLNLTSLPANTTPGLEE